MHPATTVPGARAGQLRLPEAIMLRATLSRGVATALEVLDLSVNELDADAVAVVARAPRPRCG